MLKIKVSRLSHFIVKSERVNALRKQYDAFLEEDKKRKERNEYILGRLDNMRYSSTAVQIRHKPIVYGDVMPIFNRGAYRPEQFERRNLPPDPDLQINGPTHHNMHLDVQRNYLDNTSLLKEISKKYILIPKLRSSLDRHDFVGTIPPQSLPPIAVSSPQPNTISNDDWKSKYDILEQLKKKEKEEQGNKYANDELYPVRENQCKDDTKVIDSFSPKQNVDEFKSPERDDGIVLQRYNTKELGTKYEHEVAEKDLTLDKIKAERQLQNIERPKVNDIKNQDHTTDYAPSSASAYTDPKINKVNKSQNQNLENHAPDEVVEQSVYDSSYSNENVIPSEHTNEVISNNNEHQISDIPHKVEYPIAYEPGNFPDSKKVYLDPDDYSPIEVVEPSDIVKQIPNEPVEIKESEAVENPDEMLNVQDFTPTDDVKLIDGENVNPMYLASEDKTQPVYDNDPQAEYTSNDKHTVDHQDSSGIETFDAEQKEMFYPETTPEYGYEQQQSNAYDQDYANAPAEEYPYYESPATALQEQEFPAEINEHEETDTRYDQNYEQQYAADYEQQQYQGQEQQQYVQNEGYDQTDQQQYAQPEGYDQTEQQQYVQPEGYDQTEQQQYVQPEGYDQTEQQQYVQPEGYDQTEQQQYEGYDQTEQYQYEYQQDTVEGVQQVLDNEAGYVVEQNSEATKVENEVEPATQVADEKIA